MSSNQINKEVPLMAEDSGNIVLFTPHVPSKATEYVSQVLGSRWIGQGPRVDEFETKFSERFCGGNSSIAVGSGTDALHLAYLLAGVEKGDEVAVPVFTCTATNIPLLYIGAKPVFVDIDPKTMNINIDHLRRVVTSKTKAIVVVHYGGLPCDMDEILDLARDFGIPVIEDAAHAVGAKYKGNTVGTMSDFTMFSFQAIKHITTGDGGLLSFRDSERLELAKRLRWFGIDRSSKQLGIWENDIREVGYKYQMTDIGAAMGLAGLEEFSSTLSIRQKLLSKYEVLLDPNPNVDVIAHTAADREHAAWLCTISVDRRRDLQQKLLDNQIESNQVHYRNDRYSIFSEEKLPLPNMDHLEERYLCLPLHTKMSVEDVERICEVINSGW
jgi:dTDP-4-amino-4,6-dideoxygalactose transaminase